MTLPGDLIRAVKYNGLRYLTKQLPDPARVVGESPDRLIHMPIRFEAKTRLGAVIARATKLATGSGDGSMVKDGAQHANNADK